MTAGTSGYDDGYIPGGTVVSGIAELQGLLDQWVRDSERQTIGDVGSFGGKPWLKIEVQGRQIFHLNADTKRAAVLSFLKAAAAAGGADKLAWRVIANRGRKVNKVVYGDQDDRLQGWYGYTPIPLSAPGPLL
ncbi:hypothetical protein [Streptomyces sp. NPDC086519]|uniref:hypothetical protein n=1 Tax=Streptomyces sp. NPDC086519 TaxID=3154863 RepID=UPI0034496678